MEFQICAYVTFVKQKLPK